MKTILKLNLAAAVVAATLFAAGTEPEAGTDELDERALDRAFAVLLGATHGGYCVSYTGWEKRRIYVTGVFSVDMDGWRNVAEDRPSTPAEVSQRFEIDYAGWLDPRYEGVFLHKTRCWLFSIETVHERREQDIEDFRELGHRVVETDWTPATT